MQIPTGIDDSDRTLKMMPTTFTLREADPEDVTLLAALAAEVFYDTFAADNNPEDMAAYMETAFHPEQIAAELADPNALFLLAESDGALVGYAKLYAGKPEPCITGPHPIELVRLYVRMDWHGKGVGAALMRACLKRVVEMRCETIWLGVWDRNRRARAFYRKWGFQEVGTHIFQLGADTQTDLVMERPVSATPEVREGGENWIGS